MVRGRRIPDQEAGSYPTHEPGDYGWIGAELWVFPPPSAQYPHAHVAMLEEGPGKWAITRHDDGTVTVDPSIHEMPAKDGGPSRWHGYLKAGNWEECG